MVFCRLSQPRSPTSGRGTAGGFTVLGGLRCSRAYAPEEAVHECLSGMLIACSGHVARPRIHENGGRVHARTENGRDALEFGRTSQAVGITQPGGEIPSPGDAPRHSSDALANLRVARCPSHRMAGMRGWPVAGRVGWRGMLRMLGGGSGCGWATSPHFEIRISKCG